MSLIHITQKRTSRPIMLEQGPDVAVTGQFADKPTCGQSSHRLDKLQTTH